MSAAAASYAVWQTIASGRKLRTSLAMRDGRASQNTIPSTRRGNGGASVNVASRVGEPGSAEASTCSSSSCPSASNLRARLGESGSR
jgi:hypothetical protein